MSINPDLPQPASADLLQAKLSSAQLIRNRILQDDHSSPDMIMKTRWNTGDQSIYVETTDVDVEKRLPYLSRIEGVLISVGNPWRLLTQALALGRCEGIIMLDHHPMQTEVLFPLFIDALQVVPFSQSRDIYIRAIAQHIRQGLPQLITDIQQKYPKLFAHVRELTSYSANYDPDEIEGRIQISLQNDFDTFGDNFILASQNNIQRVLEWLQAGKIISTLADLTDRRLGDVLSGCLTRLQQNNIAAIDISNCADRDPTLLVDNLQQQKLLENAVILYSEQATHSKPLSATIANSISVLRDSLIH